LNVGIRVLPKDPQVEKPTPKSFQIYVVAEKAQCELTTSDWITAIGKNEWVIGANVPKTLVGAHACLPRAFPLQSRDPHAAEERHENLVFAVAWVEDAAAQEVQIAMPFCAGGNLFDTFLQAREKMEEPTANNFVVQLFTGVAHLHAAGILDRDSAGGQRPTHVALGNEDQPR
jgi:serine/threonine protein kinase